MTKKIPHEPESILQKQWGKTAPGAVFSLMDGTVVRVLSPGVLNKQAGPDFLNACLEFNGTLKRGSIEIHRKTSDWISHGHSGNPDYDNVILHVVRLNDSAPSNVPFLPEVPVLCLPESTPENPQRTLPHTLCTSFFSAMSLSEAGNFLEAAGLDRLKMRASLRLPDIITHGTGKAFLSALAEQLGVPDNRDPFRKLGERLFAYPDSILEAHCEAIAWGESGLLPDPAAEKRLNPAGRVLVERLWNEWWTLRREAGEKLVFSRLCRPLNSPERRLAMFSAWATSFFNNIQVKLTTLILAHDKPEELLKALAEQLDVDPYWTNHTSFRSGELKRGAGLFSSARLAELLVDVILPFVCALAKINRDDALEERTVRLFLQIPPLQANTTTKLMSSTCFGGRAGLVKNAAVQQGLIHLYKAHCEPNSFYCRVCAVYRSFHTQDN